MDAGDRGLGKIVDCLHRTHHGVGADPAGDGIEVGPGQHPIEVAAGREALAGAAKDHHPNVGVSGKQVGRLDDGARVLGIEGVHRFRPVEGHSRHAVVDARQYGGGHGHHIRKTPNFVGPIGWFIDADKASASAMRVSTGSRMPSSHSRAVA
jgi:hypothetical protein